MGTQMWVCSIYINMPPEKYNTTCANLHTYKFLNVCQSLVANSTVVNYTLTCIIYFTRIVDESVAGYR